MRAMSFYDDLSELNDRLYSGAKDFKSYKLLETYSGSSGLFVALYDIGNGETLFAIKGSEFTGEPFDLADGCNDAQLWAKKYCPQVAGASAYFLSIRKKYLKIIFTGYSLGGSVAQCLCKQYGNEAICFEPYGTGKANVNCINFGNFWDIVFMQNPNEMPGKTYLVPMNIPKSGRRGFETHLPFQHGKPSTAKLVDKPLESNIDYYARIFAKKVSDKVDVAQKYVRKGLDKVLDKLPQGLHR